MNDDELKAYARHQIKEAASHVDYVGLFEGYPEFVGDDNAELSDEDGRKVDDLIRSATVTVMFPPEPLADEIETFRTALSEWQSFAEKVTAQQAQLSSLLSDLRTSYPEPAPNSSIAVTIERLEQIVSPR